MTLSNADISKSPVNFQSPSEARYEALTANLAAEARTPIPIRSLESIAQRADRIIDEYVARTIINQLPDGHDANAIRLSAAMHIVRALGLKVGDIETNLDGSPATPFVKSGGALLDLAYEYGWMGC